MREAVGLDDGLSQTFQLARVDRFGLWLGHGNNEVNSKNQIPRTKNQIPRIQSSPQRHSAAIRPQPTIDAPLGSSHDGYWTSHREEHHDKGTQVMTIALQIRETNVAQLAA